MKHISSIQEIRNEIKLLRSANKIIGFVPTMGYLHKGHQALIQQAKKTCDIVVLSIFVNPLQFSPNEDLNKYPRDLGQDKILCAESGVDIIFTPNTDKLIIDSLTSISIKTLTTNLCGKSRPGHFDGVCTIVTKLFNIVLPGKAFFGKKDIQQLQIIRKLVKDLNFDIEIVGVDIVRTNLGLALSSRNSYLTDSEKIDALVINQTLNEMYKLIKSGKSRQSAIEHAVNKINSVKNCTIDYIDIVDSNELQITNNFQQSYIIALAVYIGKTRLIDNMLVENNNAN